MLFAPSAQSPAGEPAKVPQETESSCLSRVVFRSVELAALTEFMHGEDEAFCQSQAGPLRIRSRTGYFLVFIGEGSNEHLMMVDPGGWMYAHQPEKEPDRLREEMIHVRDAMRALIDKFAAAALSRFLDGQDSKKVAAATDLGEESIALRRVQGGCRIEYKVRENGKAGHGFSILVDEAGRCIGGSWGPHRVSWVVERLKIVEAMALRPGPVFGSQPPQIDLSAVPVPWADNLALPPREALFIDHSPVLP